MEADLLNVFNKKMTELAWATFLGISFRRIRCLWATYIKLTFLTHARRWLGNGPNITVVDTPGFKDTDDAEFVDEIMNVLGDEVQEVDSFLIVYKYKDR